MTVGYVADKGQLDNIAGQLSRLIEQWAPDVLKIQQYLVATPDADLEAPPFNYSADDVALLKSAFNDLSLLARIYQGNDVLAEKRDLGEFSRRMAGLYL